MKREAKMGFDLKTTRKIFDEAAIRYAKAGCRAEKTRIIDETTAMVQYARKYVIAQLNARIRRYTAHFNGRSREVAKAEKKPKKKRIYNVKYDAQVVAALEKIWRAFGFCGQRLVPFIRSNLDALQAEKSFGITDEIAAKLRQMSSATADRALKKSRESSLLRGISTTKAGREGINSLIPIRTYFKMDERRPGYCEMDTVAHCGGSAAGEFVSTLTVTDVGTGWTELHALLNKAHRWVKEAVEASKGDFPFDLIELNGDNGSEFKNRQLLEWCGQNGVKLTRSRPYKKNDNCFVEQKNNDLVRKIAGYARFEGREAVDLMNDLYAKYCDLVNFFYPSMRLVLRERIDKKLKKRYDLAKTPFERCLESPDLTETQKDALRRRKGGLNVLDLQRQVVELQRKLWQAAVNQSAVR